MESIFLNGTGARVVSTSPPPSYIAVFGEFLYWVNSQGTVKRADKFTGGDAVVLGKVNYRPTGLQVFAKERQNCKLCLRLNLGLFWFFPVDMEWNIELKCIVF